MKKKNKRLITIVGLLLIVFVGATFAYYTSNTTFENVFNSGKYKVTLTEVFESPDNWVPGETVPKTITAKNEGTVDATVRISYTEQWLKEIDGVETDITSQVSPNPAIINFANQGDWALSNGYYYYKYILEPTDESSSFISGVTLDPSLDSVTCTGEGNERTCEAQNIASGAKYKLTFTIETAQADQYQNIWGTDVAIEKKQLVVLPTGRTKDNLQVGDEICVEGDTEECFNFIRYDGTDIVMLAKYNLKVGYIGDNRGNTSGVYTEDDDGYGLQSSQTRGYIGESTIYGAVAFSADHYWSGADLLTKYGTSYPADVYDPDYVTAPARRSNCIQGYCFETSGYSLAYYVEGYREKLEEYGLVVKNSRLLTYGEATDPSIGCVADYSYSCPNDSFITNTSFWTGSAVRNQTVWSVLSHSNTSFNPTYGVYEDSLLGVRPVIVISKNDI